MNYFLISVSNKNNLELCLKYAMTGFTNSINGVWTFLEIDKGDYISFLYGAKAFNLYKVKEKIAIKNAENVPPWPKVTFSMSGNTYYFPFRLLLEPIRRFEESLVRAEFSYVAENLLLRGGYRKTHFQADQTTLQSVSQMGQIYNQNIDNFKYSNYELFYPKFTAKKELIKIPEVFLFQELILQNVVKNYLEKNENLEKILKSFKINEELKNLEILSEKALPQGHIDLLIKESIPIGKSNKIVIEIKKNKATKKDVDQLYGYTQELMGECLLGILIAKNFSKELINYAKNKNLGLISYDINLELDKNCYYFEEIIKNFSLICL